MQETYFGISFLTNFFLSVDGKLYFYCAFYNNGRVLSIDISVSGNT